MRIAIINDKYGTGSIGRLSKELADELISRENQVLFFYANGLVNSKNCIKISNRVSQVFHAVLSRLTGLQGYFSHFSTLMLIRKLNKFHPDIIHLHNLHSNYLNLKLLAKYLKIKHIAIVITLHDCWFFTGKCTYYEPCHCTKWMNKCGKCPLLHFDKVNPTFYFDTTKKCLRNKADWFATNKRLAVIGVSNWITAEARKSIYKERYIKCIYNWIDQNTFHYRNDTTREILCLPKKKIVLMVSANLSVKKGYKELRFLADNLSKEFQLVYIGSNNQKLFIPSNVIHIEHTNCANQLAEYYSVADVCVNTTQYETFGMVTAEALSCGTPVIVYNNTASPELIGPECGIVVNEQEEIIRAVFDIIKWDRETTREICVSWARMTFCKKLAIDQYIEVYKDLIGGK